MYLPSQNAIPTQRSAESKLLKRLPRRLRSPLPINKHTPPLPTSPTIPAHTRLAPILQCLLQDLIIKRTGLQPHTLNTHLLRFFEDLFRDFRGRDDRYGGFGWVGECGEVGECGVGLRVGGDGGGGGVDGRCGEGVMDVPVEY
jgi:hypothetical protein